jgi:hypothetical protein
MLRRSLMVALLLELPGSSLSAQRRTTASLDPVVSALVFTARMPKEPAPYWLPVASQIEDYRVRAEGYRGKQRPMPSSDFAMVYRAWETAERRLVAASAHPAADSLAHDWVESARPAYEWEGFHDGPEADAMAAERYLDTNRDGPFAEYLRLFAGHRRLCSAEGYEGEKRPSDAVASRALAMSHLNMASESSNALIRLAAQWLLQNPRCF